MAYEVKELIIPTGPDAGGKYYEVHKDGARQVGFSTMIECDIYIQTMTPPPLKVSACCGGTIGYDAWVDSNGDVCGGENPTEVDAESDTKSEACPGCGDIENQLFGPGDDRECNKCGLEYSVEDK